jgi:hypothetical protein
MICAPKLTGQTLTTSRVRTEEEEEEEEAPIANVQLNKKRPKPDVNDTKKKA